MVAGGALLAALAMSIVLLSAHAVVAVVGIAQSTSLTIAMATLIVAALLLPIGAFRVPLAGRVARVKR